MALGQGLQKAGHSEKLGIPFLQAYLVPFTPPHEFPSVLAPLPHGRLTRWAYGLSHRLTQRLMWQMSDRGMQERAADLGQRIRSEDGVARAVAVIERSREYK